MTGPIKFRRGFTLLELILALALSVVIMSAIATSIFVCVSTLTEQQKEIENKQVARNVVAMVSNDLRAALQYKPADVSGLENLALSQAMTAGMGLTDPADGAAAGGGTPEDGAAPGDSGATTPPATTAAPDSTGGTEAMDPEDCVSCRPTMIGTTEVLMVDISRLPRIDEYNPLVAMRNDPALPSDVKGITYFIAEPNGQGTTGSRRDRMFTDEVEQMGGLYRRQIDRAVAAYAGEETAISNVDNYTNLIAPEVAELSFRYFDGNDWQDAWDSVEMDRFPMAIEIVLVLDPARLTSERGTYSYNGFNEETMQRIRKVIHLPIAEPPPEEE